MASIRVIPTAWQIEGDRHEKHELIQARCLKRFDQCPLSKDDTQDTFGPLVGDLARHVKYLGVTFAIAEELADTRESPLVRVTS